MCAFDFMRFVDADSALQLVTIMPDQRRGDIPLLSACTFADDDERAPLGRMGIAATGADECHHRPTHRLCATNVV